MNAQGKLAGKIALITGSASGIGEATARVFAREGALVLISDIREDLGEAVATDIGESAHFIPLDVVDPGSWERAISHIGARFGGLDILVNNAGCGAGGGILIETLEDHRRVMDVNVTGVWLGIRTAIPQMERRGGGSVVNISSIDGLVGVEGLSSYVGSKHAVTGMTRSLGLELGRRGIRVNSVHPGVIETPMVKNTHARSMERLRKAVERQPIPRMGRPEEVAKAVLFLASDDSSYCTGTSLVVDGGHVAGPYRDPF